MPPIGIDRRRLQLALRGRRRRRVRRVDDRRVVGIRRRRSRRLLQPPDPHVGVAAGRQRRPALVEERHGDHRLGVLAEVAQVLAGLHVPQPHRRVGPRRTGPACRPALKATLLIPPSWPEKTWIGLPVSASHSRNVRSSPPDRTRLPSAENTAGRHRIGVAGERLQHLARFRVGDVDVAARRTPGSGRRPATRRRR